MHAVKGIYENGRVKLLEKVGRQDPCEVIVTFLEDEEDEVTRRKRIEEIMSFAGMLNDLSEDQMAAFDQSLMDRFSFNREIDL